MHDADTLLGQVEEIYTWFPIGSPSPRPSSSRGRVPGAADTPRDSASAFGENWDELLPSERERAVDKLLAAFCELCTSPGFDVQSVRLPSLRVVLSLPAPLTA